MDWSDLRCFLALTRHGSLAAAGRVLGMDATTVGRRIAALEAALSVRLFDRGPDGLHPTDAGNRLIADAEAMESAANAFARRAGAEKDRPSGIVRLATSDSMAQGYLLARLAGLRVRHPEIVLELLTGAGALNLVRNEADLAVRIGISPNQDSLVVRKLGDMGWGLYAATAWLHRHGRVEDLRGIEVVGYHADLRAAKGPAWLEAMIPEACVAVRVNSIISARAACAAGFGVAALPCILAGPDLLRVRPDLADQTPAYLVQHPDLRRSARVSAVAEFVVEAFRADAGMLGGR